MSEDRLLFRTGFPQRAFKGYELAPDVDNETARDLQIFTEHQNSLRRVLEMLISYTWQKGADFDEIRENIDDPDDLSEPEQENAYEERVDIAYANLLIENQRMIQTLLHLNAMTTERLMKSKEMAFHIPDDTQRKAQMLLRLNEALMKNDTKSKKVAPHADADTAQDPRVDEDAADPTKTYSG